MTDEQTATLARAVRVLPQALKTWGHTMRASVLVTVVMFDWFVFSWLFGR